MDAFRYSRAGSVADAVTAAAKSPQVKFIAGGTNLVDLMKLRVERPEDLLDVNGLPLDKIEKTPAGGLRIGALVRNSDLAHDPTVQSQYAVLSQALLSGASPQLRNMATTGGNLLQRTRCVYFRDTAHACNKRVPGSGCSAIGGHNRMLAILGTSDACIATNPSDMNVALAALEATIQIQGAPGKGGQAERSVPVGEFFLEPGNTPQRENLLEPGELITSVTLPPMPAGTKTVYLKLRDRAAYEFALASAAVVVETSGGTVKRARVALGGVGTKPWRSLAAEHVLEGKKADPANFRHAAEEALKGARPQSENGFKVELAKRCLVRAMTMATATA